VQQGLGEGGRYRGLPGSCLPVEQSGQDQSKLLTGLIRSVTPLNFELFFGAGVALDDSFFLNINFLLGGVFRLTDELRIESTYFRLT
jgi:hypothetical protein